MKSYLVDTIGTIVFFTTVASFSELFIAGMEPRQVMITRLVTIAVMMVTGRPYGLWRDLVFGTLSPQRRLSNFLCDIAAFLTFQVPVYVATLVLAGATVLEISASVGSAFFFMIALSRPFGVFLDTLRRLAKTSVG